MISKMPPIPAWKDVMITLDYRTHTHTFTSTAWLTTGFTLHTVQCHLMLISE